MLGRLPSAALVVNYDRIVSLRGKPSIEKHDGYPEPLELGDVGGSHLGGEENDSRAFGASQALELL